MRDGGAQRAAEYVGESELSAWFGGSPTVMVVYEDTRAGAAVAADRVIPRETWREHAATGPADDAYRTAVVAEQLVAHGGSSRTGSPSIVSPRVLAI